MKKKEKYKEKKEIRIINTTKKSLYDKMIRETDVQISYSTFL
jgi:hypothetical protein